MGAERISWGLSNAETSSGHGAPRPAGRLRLCVEQAAESGFAAWKQQHNASHRRVRARAEHTFARMKTWKILRHCRRKGEGVHHAMLGIFHPHNPARRP
ncbi:transposase [Streptomyces massasporeus]|uniref:transposase n=1 Tax=Streptomyces massasporeus TaxID=67324 RepID=UPI0037013D2E